MERTCIFLKISDILCLRHEPKSLGLFLNWLDSDKKYGVIKEINRGIADVRQMYAAEYLNWAREQIKTASAINLVLEDDLRDLSALDFPPDICQLHVSHSPATIVGRKIDLVRLNETAQGVLIKDSMIRRLELWAGPTNLKVENSSIDELVLNHCIANPCSFEKTTILQVIIANPMQKPTTGDVTFKKVFIPRRDIRGHLNIQHVRTWRQNLSDTQNLLAASVLRGVELAHERSRERLPARVISYIYEVGADFGNSITRPLGWFVFALGATLLVAFVTDGVESGVEEGGLHGWQHSLFGDGFLPRLFRCFIYAGQSIFNPLGLFSSRSLLITADVFSAITLSITSLIGTLSLVLFVISLRRRFKVES